MPVSVVVVVDDKAESEKAVRWVLADTVERICGMGEFCLTTFNKFENSIERKTFENGFATLRANQ